MKRLNSFFFFIYLLSQVYISIFAQQIACARYQDQHYGLEDMSFDLEEK